MDTHVKKAPLSGLELDQLAWLLATVTNPRALSIEGMDGLFCALIAGPAWVTPSAYLPLLWGAHLPDETLTFNAAHVNAMIWLLTRHWNSIQTELDRGDVHPPLIVHRVDHIVPGRVWAQGFMRGVNFVQVGWKDLLQDTSSELRRIPLIARETNSLTDRKLVPLETPGEIVPWLGRAVADAYQHFLDRRLADRSMVESMDEATSRW